MAELSLRARVTVAVVATLVLLGGALGYAVAVRSDDSVTPVGTRARSSPARGSSS